MELITVTNVVLMGVIIALTQLLKTFVSERFIALIPVVLGVAGVIALIGVSVEAVFTGLIIGLASAGLYDQKQLKG